MTKLFNKSKYFLIFCSVLFSSLLFAQNKNDVTFRYAVKIEKLPKIGLSKIKKLGYQKSSCLMKNTWVLPTGGTVYYDVEVTAKSEPSYMKTLRKSGASIMISSITISGKTNSNTGISEAKVTPFKINPEPEDFHRDYRIWKSSEGKSGEK